MLEAIVRKEIIIYIMGALMALGVLAKLISFFTTRKMVKEAREIQKSNHKLLKLVKAKFEHASLVSDRVQNVEAFVDKYIYEYKVLGIRLNTWRNFGKKVLWVVLALGLFAIFESFRMEGMGELMLNAVQWTGLFVMSLFLLCFITEEESRLNAAKNYMIEYLENVCIHRYAKMNQAIEEEKIPEPEPVEMKEEEKSLDAVVAEELDDVQEKAEQEKSEQEKSEQEMRIRAILQEFLA